MNKTLVSSLGGANSPSVLLIKREIPNLIFAVGAARTVEGSDVRVDLNNGRSVRWPVNRVLFNTPGNVAEIAMISRQLAEVESFESMQLIEKKLWRLLSV